jgi:hypothetical protein
MGLKECPPAETKGETIHPQAIPKNRANPPFLRDKPVGLQPTDWFRGHLVFGAGIVILPPEATTI